jgi:hypothetical protein
MNHPAVGVELKCPDCNKRVGAHELYRLSDSMTVHLVAVCIPCKKTLHYNLDYLLAALYDAYPVPGAALMQ